MDQHWGHWIPVSHRRVLGSKPSWVKDLARALLRVQDVNVLVVDWVYSASFAYNLVVEGYKEVAVQISILLSQLQVGGASGITLQRPAVMFRITFESVLEHSICFSHRGGGVDLWLS